jgi:HEAT repeat protein
MTTNIHQQRIQRILGKLEEIRRKGLACFGSDAHGFRLKAPLQESSLVQFESEHSIRLPEDFRAFLRHAGNGGAGPYYGLYSLNQYDDFTSWICDEVPRDFLTRPCPLKPGRNDSPPADATVVNASRYQGTISIGSQGCTYAMQLVVSGKYAGRVVYVDADGQPPYMVRDVDFLSWFERWLDELLQGYDTSWFGHGPGGGESEFARIVATPDAEEDVRAEAVNAYCRLPKLSESARSSIPHLCRDSAPGVRVAACSIIRKFSIFTALADVTPLLDDPDAAVRSAAVSTAMALDPATSANRVLRLMWSDPEESVASTAFFKLKDADKLPRTELIAIVAMSPFGSLRYCAANAVTWEDGDEDFLIGRLSDENSQVRFYATLGLRKLKAREALGTMLELLSREQDLLVVGSILRFLGELCDCSAVPVLLDWAKCKDDFHRLDALDSLAKIGDDRAIPIAREFLRENRSPERRDSHGLPVMSNVHSIADLARKSLQSSPNPALQNLEGGGWLSRFRGW